MTAALEQCPQCDSEVAVEVQGAYLKCERCGMRFPRPRKKGHGGWSQRDDVDGLGIHPALAKRLRERQPALEASPSPPVAGELSLDDDVHDLPSVQLSPSLIEETNAGKVNGSSDERVTSVESKPGALRSNAAQPASTRPLRPSLERPSSGVPNDTPLQRPATKAPKAKEPMPQLPGLEMIEQVGKGAMGRVFRAKHSKSGREVAVKLLAAELAARPDFVARFEREAAALKRVDHNAVVRIVESGSHRASGAEGEHHYLVMQFVEGVSLRRILDGGPLTPGRALDFARQITQGLAAAHDKSVIHRDLKPENILVERTKQESGDDVERLVLVDFGLAGIIEESEDPHPNLTKSRMTMGTVNYMAPEQRTDAKRVDQRADLYAAGVILYELLTGDLPLGRFALPRERGLPLPESVDDCVHKALARNADERFQTAQELDAALGRIQAELSRAASMDTLVGRSLLSQSDLDDSLESDMPVGSVRSLAPRAPPDELSTASGEHGRWMTAPPWVKRPELLWGVLALAVGAGSGLWLAGGSSSSSSPTDPERAVAAALALVEEGGGVKATLGKGDGSPWQRLGGEFALDGAAVTATNPAPRPGDPALLVHPVPLSSSRVAARAIVTADDVDAGEGRVASTEATAGYAGVLLRDDGGHAVGVVRFSDRSCGVLELTEEAARVSPFRCPTERGPVEIGISCELPGGRCVVDAGGAAPVEYTARPGYAAQRGHAAPTDAARSGGGAVSLALACAATSCRFQGIE